MFELIEFNPPLEVLDDEYQRLLGFPKSHQLTGRPRELADAARQWYAANGRPWIYAREIGPLELRDVRVHLAGTVFSSNHLHDSLAAAQAHSAVALAASAGRECEEMANHLWQEGKPDEYFFMEIFGSAVVEQLVALANGRICGWAEANGMVALPHYSPGYSGWDMAEQARLGKLIRHPDAGELPGELEVLETGMLRPKKSLLALIGLTRHREMADRYAKLTPCQSCHLPACQYRRAPRIRALPQLESIHRHHVSVAEETSVPARSALSKNANYSVNARALKKWSEERLRLHILPDGRVEAHFHYEGTTCSNLGRALEFDYHVKLGTARDHYRILETNCTPSPTDTDHTQQCEYLKNAGPLMANIATEKPLLGRPLDEVLTWVRTPNPSGCYCDLERRNHKWGLVFEVIHFALAQCDTAGMDEPST
jgi:hypothetical protein